MPPELDIWTLPPRELPTILAIFVLVVGFVFGSLWGSFLNVVIARVPKGQSVVTPRSRCPKCGTMITARDNIPLLSWLMLRGKCRVCGAPISARYPFVELLGGVAGAAVVARWGLSLPALELFAFILILIAISFIDLDTFTVPTSLVVGLVVVGLGGGLLRWQLLAPGSPGALTGQDVVDRVIGGVAAGLMLASVVYLSTFVIRLFQERRRRAALARRRIPVAQRSKKKWRRREGAMRLPPDELAMGLGDPMILAGLGACLGWQQIPLALFLASVLGSIIGLALRFSGKLKGRGPISEEDPWIPPDGAVPFGPFLALGGLLAAFFGQAIHARVLPLLGLGEGGVLLQYFE
jgi:leader peptidase (prepilin peptidase) / N-methyltransferase